MVDLPAAVAESFSQYIVIASDRETLKDVVFGVGERGGSGIGIQSHSAMMSL